MRFTPLFACVILSIITSSVIGVPVPPASAEGGVARRSQEETLHEDVHRGVGRLYDGVTLSVKPRSPEGEMWKNNVHEEVQEKVRSASPTPEYSPEKRLLPVAVSNELQA
ncbi:hypothetical protein F5141DRAFT_1215755 [Pisolithus sp. B1]|nr:hypothetical protein F5141DRAFT_1215755 [Pisolithus sp. B1]KAI6129828.1 hypothetical protein EV401DRAFT_1926652 [Pisolithus croceorrhizus]